MDEERFAKYLKHGTTIALALGACWAVWYLLTHSQVVFQ